MLYLGLFWLLMLMGIVVWAQSHRNDNDSLRHATESDLSIGPARSVSLRHGTEKDQLRKNDKKSAQQPNRS